MRSLLPLLLLLPLHAAFAQPGAVFGDLGRESLEAYQRKDYAQLQDRVEAMLALRPGHPRLLYNLAAAQALLGDRPAAIANLQRLQRMGLSFSPQSDADFATLKSDAGFGKAVTGFQRNALQQGSAKIAFSAGTRSFIPEGLAYDAAAQNFYLGSVRERRIVRIDRRQHEQPFVTSGRDGLWSVQGLQVDPAAQLLWAASSALPEMQDFDPIVAGRSGLFGFDLKDGRLRHRFPLPADGREHSLGDVIVAADGRLYVSDSAAAQVLTLDRNDGRWQPLAPAGTLASPQGLAFSASGDALMVADYALGLMRFDLKSARWQKLTVPDDVCVYGIDGLYRHGEDWIAVQNGITPHRVLRIRLNASGTAVQNVEVLAAALSEFEEPTLGTIVGDYFFLVANSQWNRFDAQHRLPDTAQLAVPRILRLDLKPQ